MMRARLLDPSTSHAAARSSALFSGSHCERIAEGLKEEPLSAAELAKRIGLTVVQIDRRLPEMERAGRVEVVRVDAMVLTRRGYRVWRLTA